LWLQRRPGNAPAHAPIDFHPAFLSAGEKDVAALVAAAAKAYGGVDVLVNNAAAFVFGEVTVSSTAPAALDD
jgi:NAD(P)-dependent dehydrogenase (short-subunit alcohol dehydrogenase family)